MSQTIILTGSHHTPAIEVIKKLKLNSRQSYRLVYLGHLTPTDSHITKTIIPKLGVNFYHIPSGKFNRLALLTSVLSIPLIFAGIIKSFFLIQKLRPALVVSFGGYVSVPVVIAAWLHSVPSITHEQTLTVSLATRINSYFVNKVALSFPETKNINSLPVGKIIVTGNILRHQIHHSRSSTFSRLLPRLKAHPLIYVTGGSQGSQFINQLIAGSLPKLKNFTIIHQCGTANPLPPAGHNYLPIDYVSLTDIGWIFRHSQLVISRSGANTCQELRVLSKKSILIPLPKSQQDEQNLNARWLFSQQPRQTVILPQNQATPARLVRAIHQLQSAPTQKPPSVSPSRHPLLNLIYEFV